MNFNDWDHIIKTDARQLITTKITSSQVNFLVSSQIILCSLNLYSWNANTTCVRPFFPSNQYISVNPSRRFVWCSFPFHGLLSVPTGIGLQHNFCFWHGHKILNPNCWKCSLVVDNKGSDKAKATQTRFKWISSSPGQTSNIYIAIFR
jgi:hypothetical protein